MIGCGIYGSRKIDNLVQNSPIVRDYTFNESLKSKLNWHYFTEPQPRFNRATNTFDAIRSAFVNMDGNVFDSRFKNVYDHEFKPIAENADDDAEKIFRSASKKIDAIASNKLIECDKKLEELARHPDIAQLKALQRKYYETANPLWMFRK